MDHLFSPRRRAPHTHHNQYLRPSRNPSPSGYIRRRCLRIHPGASFSRRSLPQDHGRGPRTLMGAWIMAGVTFREAARRKILWTALLAGSTFLALFGTGMHFQIKDLTRQSLPPFVRYQLEAAMLQVGFYAVDLLAVVMTILTSVDTLSGEMASGTIQAIATKPISRWEVLMGKWVGFAGMVAAYVAAMFG